MREIKFRGLKINDEFAYGSYHKITGFGNVANFRDNVEFNSHYILQNRLPTDVGWTISDSFISCEVRPETIGEYTGLKDKNGVEIYEGDILEICNGSINGQKWPEPNKVVKYEKCGFNLHSFMWDKHGKIEMDSTHYCIVIGNIHQHPHLLQ